MLLKKRIADRDRCEFEAKIALPGTEVPLSCLVRDISEHGACLVVPDEMRLPPRFDLLLPVSAEIVDRRPVELRWQHDRTLGVLFERS